MNDWFLSSGLAAVKPILAGLVLPPIPWLLLVLIGALWMRRHWWAGALLVTLGVTLEYLSFTPAAAEATVRWLLAPPPPLRDPAVALRPTPVPGKNVIVVLGGGRTPYAEYHEVSLSSLAMERLRYGVWLSRETGLPLAFSGGIAPGAGGGPTEAGIARRIAEQEFRLPLRWVEDRSGDTRENAIETVKLLQDGGIGRIVLVTHDLHMPRALRHFQRARDAAGLRFDILPAPVGITEAGASWSVHDWLPSPRGIARSRYAWREWLGLLAGA